MKFVFSPPLIIDRFNAHELTPVQSAQLLEAGNAVVGRNTLEAIFREAERLETFWERYRVARADTGEVVYDAWALNSDSGRVFIADTAQQTGIAMTQTGFEGDADPDVIEALDAGHRKIGEAFDSAKSRAHWEDYRKKETAASAQAGTAGSVSVPPTAPSRATAPVQATSARPIAPAEAGPLGAPAPAGVVPVEVPSTVTEPVAKSRATRVKSPSRSVKRPVKRKRAAVKKARKPVAAKASRADSLEQARKKRPAQRAAAARKPARKAAKKPAAVSVLHAAKPARKAAAKPPHRRTGKKPLRRGSSKR